MLLANPPRAAHTGRFIAVRDGNGGPWYTSIQAAIEAASTDPANPDTIVVESSNQTGGLLIDRPVNLISTAGTTITAPANQRALTIDGRNTSIGPNIVIQGFTFKQGDATQDNTATPGELGVPGCGGGILVIGASPTLAGNTLFANKAATGANPGRGGGICLIESAAVLTGNTIGSASNGGNQASAGGIGKGGGVYISGGAPSLTYNAIGSNFASATGSGDGAGVYIDHSAAILRQNSVSNNRAAFEAGAVGNGGGVYIDSAPAGGSAAQLIGNGISSNYASIGGAGKGGGIFVSQAAATLQGNVIILNRASLANASTGFGGGIYVDGAAPALIRNQLIENYASDGTGAGGGGAIWLQDSAATLVGNIIQKNTFGFASGGPGQAIGIAGGGGWQLVNNVIARNALNGAAGSAIAISNSSGVLLHTTIAENSDFDSNNLPTPPTAGQVGVHISGTSAVTLTNTILMGHAIGIRTTSAGASAVLAHSLFFRNTQADTDTSAGGTIASSAALAGDPAFVHTATDLPDYHLSPGSAAIDKAIRTSVTNDLEGVSRLYGAAPDIGAYERKSSSIVWLSLVKR
jgi:hypothetical protein